MRGDGPGERPTSVAWPLRIISRGTTPSVSARDSMRRARQDVPKNGRKLSRERKPATEMKNETINGANSELNRFSASEARRSSAGSATTSANTRRYARKVCDCLNSVENAFCAQLPGVGIG